MIERPEVFAEQRERQIVHIINPVSGSGRNLKKTMKRLSELKESVYLTKRGSDCEAFVAELLAKDPYAHVVAHGGDGTMRETVNGIMAAGAGETALFTGVPSGSGNDFLRYMYKNKNDLGKEYPIDLILSDGKYSVNVVNIGFDCTVVAEAEKLKKLPGVKDGSSYVLGVVKALFKKEAITTPVTMKGIPDGAGGWRDETLEEGKYLLAAIANCGYYGGGFAVAPFADPSDGLADVILVKYMSVAKFATLVTGFKKGKHLTDGGETAEKFKKYMIFRRCREISLGGIKRICCDGDISEGTEICASVVPSAVIYTPPKKEWLI